MGTAKHLASDAKAGLDARVSAETRRAGDEIKNIAGVLRHTGDELRERAPMLGDYTDQAARKLDEIADVIRTKSPAQMVRDVETFARREPALFFGGAFALGVLASRFLRSTPDGGGGAAEDESLALAEPPEMPEGWEV